MRTALQLYGFLPDDFEQIMDDIWQWMEELPDKPARSGTELQWSSHGIVRAAHRLFAALEEWEVRDGFFATQRTAHSWLYRDGQATRLILDIYPVGAHGGPLVVDTTSTYSPWHGVYFEAAAGYYVDRLAQFENEATAIVALS